MKFHQLFEATYDDLLRNEVVEFIQSNKSKYSESFITFSGSDEPEPSGIGINIIPLMYFVNNPMDYETLINKSKLLKIDVNSRILVINKVDKNSFNVLMNKLNVSDTQEMYNSILSKSNYKNKSQSYGYVLHHIIRYGTDNVKVSDQEYINRIQGLGFTGIVDTSINVNSSILSSQYPSMGYLFEDASYDVLDVVGFDDSTQIELPADDVLFDLASKIAEGLNTELNHDDPYHRGLDHYYWTFDGMQIRITETFSSSGDDHDSRSYILDLETPYGILYHVSDSGDSHKKIKNDVILRYNKMSEPLGNWRPIDRDVFLTNMNLEFKDYELKLDDIVKEVKKYYDAMRDFGLRYKIQLQPLNHYPDYDLSFMSGIIDRFSQNATAMTLLNKISNNGEVTDLDIIDDYFPRARLPKKMTFEELKRMALIYDIAKKLQPKKSGWRVFQTK